MTTMIKTAVAVAAGLALAGLTACSGSGSNDFHSIPVLEKSIKATMNKKIHDRGDSYVVKQVACVATGGNTDECNVSYSDDTSVTVTAYVAADGLSWVTK